MRATFAARIQRERRAGRPDAARGGPERPVAVRARAHLCLPPGRELPRRVEITPQLTKNLPL